MIFEGIQIEFWVMSQMAIDFILVILILWLLKNMKVGLQQDISKNTSEKVMEMIEPLLAQADDIATTFETQLREKNHLIHKLNEKLDARIISLNLLLNRTDALAANGMPAADSQSLDVYDQQASIVQLYNQGKNSTDIATALSLPRGEVNLVLDLKKKLLTIE